MPIEAKFHVELFRVVRLKVSSNIPGHVTKKASMPMYGKNPLKIFSSETRKMMTFKLGILTASGSWTLQSLFK